MKTTRLCEQTIHSGRQSPVKKNGQYRARKKSEARRGGCRAPIPAAKPMLPEVQYASSLTEKGKTTHQELYPNAWRGPKSHPCRHVKLPGAIPRHFVLRGKRTARASASSKLFRHMTSNNN